MRKNNVCGLIILSFVVILTSFILSISQAMAQQVNLQDQIIEAAERLQNNTELGEEQIAQANTDLKKAQNMLTVANEQRNLADSYEELAATASARIIELQENSLQLRGKAIKVDEQRTLEALENKLLLDVSEQNSRLAALTEKQSQQTHLSHRANEIAHQLGLARANKAEIEEGIGKQSKDTLHIISEANFLKKRATIEKLSATINALEREIETIPDRQLLVEAELAYLRVQNKHYEKVILELQSFLAKSRTKKAKQTFDQSKETLAELQHQSINAAIAQENLRLAKRLQYLQENSTRNEANMSALRTQLIDVQQSSETVERVLATGRVTDELGELLRKIRTGLPHESTIEKRKLIIEEDAIKQQLDVILWQDRLRNLTDITAAAVRLLFENMPVEVSHNDTASQQFSAQEIKTAENLALSRRSILSDLIESSNAQSDRIIEEKLTINQLLAVVSELRELLERRLIWLPSNSGKVGNLVNNLSRSFDWFVSPSDWWELINNLYKGAKESTILLGLLLALSFLILLLRRKIKNLLWSLLDRVGKVHKDTYFTTPLALILTFTLALPLPIYLFVFAAMIFSGAQPNGFSNSIAAGLASVSSVSLVLLFFRSMCRQDGVFAEHFGWSDIARDKLQKMLTWFVWIQSIAIFIFAAAIASNEIELRYGIAIIAFIVSSISTSFFSYLFFQPKNGVATSIVGGTPANLLTLIAFPIVVVAPLAIGSLPLFGFFDTAVLLQTKLFLSGTLLVLAAVVYGIMLRLFLVTFRRYVVKKKRLHAIESKKKENEPVLESSGEVSGASAEETVIDEKDVMRQSRSIILWITGLLFLSGLWFVWKSLLPALGIVDDIILWQKVKMVDGVELSSGVTLWNFITSVGFVVGGVLAAKNIRGVMEIGFFERLEMDYGSRYATMTILGYLLIGTGIVIGFSQLGIEWSKLQWIIAALGVGLGFGLQEIVANFVSGLIILFERPIRVGDFVTIGEQSGTVSNIKIRATTVTDFDNREVLLPNKSIITENVTNWTLNDTVTRIVIKIGVAYGSNIEHVHDLLMQILHQHDEVLEKPEPQVFFLEHGDSALNFEIRAFVSRPEVRLPLTHAINLSINKTLVKHDISIPFPQRDLHIVPGQLTDKLVDCKKQAKRDKNDI